MVIDRRFNKAAVFSEPHSHGGYPGSELALASAEREKHGATAGGHLLLIVMTNNQQPTKAANTSAREAASHVPVFDLCLTTHQLPR